MAPLLTAAVALSVFMRLRRAVGVERQQIKWFAYAAAANISASTLAYVIPGVIDTPLWFERPALAYFTVANEAVPIAIGIAILRYRLWDIDLLINRTLVYGALTACVVGIYVLAVGYLGALLRTDDLLISLIATGIVAVLFAPLRDRFQRAVNRLIYGERDEPYAARSRLGERLEATFAPEAVLPTTPSAK